MRDPLRILLVEDDSIVRVTVRDALEEAGYQVVDCADGRAALNLICTEEIHLLLSDVRLPEVDGITLFRKLKQIEPSSAAVLMTAYGKLEDAVAVMREGACDYITKPFEIDELLVRLDHICQDLHFRKLAESPAGRQKRVKGALPNVVSGDSPVVKRLLRRIDACANSDFSTLITGETGTGKELCARMIHFRGKRADSPFVVVNCAAIPESLLESEFFGHERGAFTGAERRREGRFRVADGGTLFLDEVGALPIAHQAKILRAIETGWFEPVGSSSSVYADVRVVAATNEDLNEAIKAGRFREDLYFRLNVIEIQMPSLRERRPDIPILVCELLKEVCGQHGVVSPAIDPGAMAALYTYEYPGNVRELLHAIEHAVALSRGDTIALHHLPESFRGPSPSDCDADDTLNEANDSPEPLCTARERFEQEYIRRVVENVDGHRGQAAKILGISRKSLWQKLRQ